MMHKRLLVASLIALTTLAGCSGGDDGDDVTINIDGGGDTPEPPPPPPPPNGDCDNTVEASFVTFNDECSVGTLSGQVDSDYVLTSDIQWRLSGTVRVGAGNENVGSAADVQAVRDAGVTLEVEPGTDIRAFDDGTLIVTRGSRLIADGTAASPITFSSLDENFDGLGEWGGVVIQGFAPQYGQGGTGPCYGEGEVCNVEGEGGTDVAVYGGNDPADNSGIIRYVRIAEGGLVAGPNNELNGLTLQGVGHATTVEYVQVHNNLDDGVEWFGGTVDARYLVLTGNDDDDIDYDEGYQGNIQYAIVQKDQEKEAPTGSNDPRAIEANSSDDDYVPETTAAIANVTIIGGPMVNNDDAEAGPQPGMRLRGALTTAIYNTSVQGFNYGCIRIDDADINGDGSVIEESHIDLVNVLNDCASGIYTHEEPDTANNVSTQTLSYSATLAINEAAAQLGSAPVINAVNNGSGFVFDQTDYVGAVDPAAASGWWEGWTIPDSLGTSESVQPASFVSCNGDNTVCTISGTIDQDYTLVSGVEWRLSGEVLVGDGNQVVDNDADVQAVRDAGVTLTVRPGVSVKAFDDGSLLVTRGSRLMAVGSAASPITFSSLDDGFDGLGEWGGVILQGFAPQFGAGGTGPCYGSGTVCNVVGEGGTVVGNYGGNDPADSSGALRYVRIAEGGLVAGPNNEINGLTLQGVGHGTQLDYIQVHGNLDDGVEWFGGTVNATHLVLTNNDDDDIDYDEGFQGNVQYAIIRKHPNKASPTGSNDPRAIEANSSDDEYAPETEAVLANILILGSDVNNNEESDAGAQPGMRLRGALTTSVYNTAVRDFDVGCVRIDDADVNGDGSNIINSDVTLVNVLGECAEGFYSHRSADTEDNAGESNNGTVTIDDAYAIIEAEASVVAPSITPVDNGSGFTFDETGYVGAVEPGTSAGSAWWSGWTIPGSLD